MLLILLPAGGPKRARAELPDIVPKPVHYVQLSMHTSIYLYWGWYWREVYHYAPLILAQIVFVYVLDMLVCWWRRDKWDLRLRPLSDRLEHQPVPVVQGPTEFFLQFLLVSTGVLCKEFVT